jgi:hypothetical protein
MHLHNFLHHGYDLRHSTTYFWLSHTTVLLHRQHLRQRSEVCSLRQTSYKRHRQLFVIFLYSHLSLSDRARIWVSRHVPLPVLSRQSRII